MNLRKICVRRKDTGRGFSLTEVIIALVVVALVLGGIWTAAAAVRKQHNIGIETSRLLEIANNVRGLYGGQPTSSRPTTVAAQIATGVFPQDMLFGGVPSNIWGGTVELEFTACCNRGFSIIYKNLDNELCVGFLSRVQGTEASAQPGTRIKPQPGISPAIETTQGGGPRRVYFQRNTDMLWIDVTRKSPVTISSQDCIAFGAFFTM